MTRKCETVYFNRFLRLLKYVQYYWNIYVNKFNISSNRKRLYR